MDNNKQNTDTPDLNRRRFLTNAGAVTVGTAGLVASAGALAAAKADANDNRVARTPGVDYDVIVIGGGNAGAAMVIVEVTRPSGIKLRNQG